MKRYIYLFFILLLVATVTAETVSLTINGDSVYHAQQIPLQANQEHVVRGSASSGIDRIVMYIFNQNVRSEDRELRFSLQPGTYELDIIGFKNDQRVASAKISLLLSEQEECVENWVCDAWQECEEDCASVTHTRWCTDIADCGYSESPRKDTQTVSSAQEVVVELSEEETEGEDKQPVVAQAEEGGFIAQCRALEEKGTVGIFTVDDLTFSVRFGPGNPELGPGEKLSFLVGLDSIRVAYDRRYIPNTQDMIPSHFEYRAAASPCDAILEYIEQLLRQDAVLEREICAPEAVQKIEAAQHRMDEEELVRTASQIIDNVQCKSKVDEAALKIRAAGLYSLALKPHLAIYDYRHISDEYRFTAPEMSRNAKYLEISLLAHQERTTCEALRELVEEYETYYGHLPDARQTTEINSIRERCSDICIHHSGDVYAPIPFVFISEGYESVEEFREHMDIALEGFQINSLLKENSDMFSFFYIYTAELDVCPHREGRGVWCNQAQVLPVERMCRGHPVVLSTKDFRAHAYPGRVSFVTTYNHGFFSRLPGISPGVDPFLPAITAHEIGHSYFRLPDEYVESRKGSRTSFACQPSLERARVAWSHIPEAEFHQGCSYVNSNVRSAKESLMNNHRRSTEFSPAARHEVERILAQVRRS